MTDPVFQETALALILGLVLASSCGLRAFLAPFFLSAAAYWNLVELGPSLGWLGSPLAAGTLAAAVIVELAADKIPFLDHAMDTLHLLLKPVAGALVGVTLLGDTAPVVTGVLGLAAGGVLAGGAHVAKAGVRVGSTATTAGMGNVVLSVLEDVAAAVVAGLAMWGASTLG